MAKENKKQAKFKSKANEKLKNIETVKKMLDGTHKTQTRKSVGFSDVADAKPIKREVGDIWVEVDPKTGKEETWEQKDGYKVKQSRFQAIRDAVKEMQSFKNCPKDECTCIKPARVDLKMRAIHGMCMDCVADMETKLKIQGKYKDYEREKVIANAKAWLAQAEQEKEEVKSALTKTEFVQEDGSMEKWEMPYDPEVMSKQIDENFEKFKQEFLDNLEKEHDGISKEIES